MPDEEINKSIELGFLGITPPEYYIKKRKVKKVRRMLKLELTGFTIFLAINLYLLVFCNYSIHIKLGLIIFIIVMVFAIILNLAVWNQIFDIKKQRFKEYNELKKANNKKLQKIIQERYNENIAKKYENRSKSKN